MLNILCRIMQLCNNADRAGQSCRMMYISVLFFQDGIHVTIKQDELSAVTFPTHPENHSQHFLTPVERPLDTL